jgi:hypothetical protein
MSPPRPTLPSSPRTPPEGHAPDGTPTSCADVSCVAARSERWLGPHCSLDERNRATFHHREELYLGQAASAVVRASALAVRRRQYPEDFGTCWWYLKCHPMNWRFSSPRLSGRRAGDLSPEELQETADLRNLVTDDGLVDLFMTVIYDTPPEESGTPQSTGVAVVLEHGPHLWLSDLSPEEFPTTPATGTSTHDYRLDVTADTYEEAVVQLAAKVAEVYGDDRERLSER